MKLKIVTTPNPVLRQKSKSVPKIDRQIKKLAQAMIQLISSSGRSASGGKAGPEDKPIGVGLSAVQIGQLKRLFVGLDPQKKDYRVFVNPKIVGKSKKLTEGVPERENKLEGCLSVPEVFGIIKRHQWIKLRYQNLQGQTKTEKFSSFLATVIQHEHDHLEGILFTDRILEQKGKIYKLEKTPEGEELAEVKIGP